MGNKQGGSYEYIAVNGDEYFIHDLKTQDDIIESMGYPTRIENFRTGFSMRNPVIEDTFIVKHGKYIYERFVYENEVVYFMKYKQQKYAWSVQSNAM
jgi:hypothetical protein